MIIISQQSKPMSYRTPTPPPPAPNKPLHIPRRSRSNVEMNLTGSTMKSWGNNKQPLQLEAACFCRRSPASQLSSKWPAEHTVMEAVPQDFTLIHHNYDSNWFWWFIVFPCKRSKVSLLAWEKTSQKDGAVLRRQVWGILPKCFALSAQTSRPQPPDLRALWNAESEMKQGHESMSHCIKCPAIFEPPNFEDEAYSLPWQQQATRNLQGMTWSK